MSFTTFAKKPFTTVNADGVTVNRFRKPNLPTTEQLRANATTAHQSVNKTLSNPEVSALGVMAVSLALSDEKVVRKGFSGLDKVARFLGRGSRKVALAPVYFQDRALDNTRLVISNGVFETVLFGNTGDPVSERRENMSIRFDQVAKKPITLQFNGVMKSADFITRGYDRLYTATNSDGAVTGLRRGVAVASWALLIKQVAAPTSRIVRAMEKAKIVSKPGASNWQSLLVIGAIFGTAVMIELFRGTKVSVEWPAPSGDPILVEDPTAPAPALTVVADVVNEDGTPITVEQARRIAFETAMDVRQATINSSSKRN